MVIFFFSIYDWGWLFVIFDFHMPKKLSKDPSLTPSVAPTRHLWRVAMWTHPHGAGLAGLPDLPGLVGCLKMGFCRGDWNEENRILMGKWWFQWDFMVILKINRIEWYFHEIWMKLYWDCEWDYNEICIQENMVISWDLMMRYWDLNGITNWI